MRTVVDKDGFHMTLRNPPHQQGGEVANVRTLASIVSWIEQEHGRKVLAIMPSMAEVEGIGETYWVVFGYGERRTIEWVVGLKSISEASGPVAEDCPPSLFELAPEVNGKWRIKCLKNFVRR